HDALPILHPLRPRTTKVSATVMPAARVARARPGRGFLEPCSALSVVKARAFLGSATTCRANSIARRPRGSYDPTGLSHLCAPARVRRALAGMMDSVRVYT